MKINLRQIALSCIEKMTNQDQNFTFYLQAFKKRDFFYIMVWTDSNKKKFIISQSLAISLVRAHQLLYALILVLVLALVSVLVLVLLM